MKQRFCGVRERNEKIKLKETNGFKLANHNFHNCLRSCMPQYSLISDQITLYHYKCERSRRQTKYQLILIVSMITSTEVQNAKTFINTSKNWEETMGD